PRDAFELRYRARARAVRALRHSRRLCDTEREFQRRAAGQAPGGHRAELRGEVMIERRRGTDEGSPAPHSHALAPEEVIRVKVKAELRKRMRGLRKTTPLEACAERSRKIVAALEGHGAVQASKRAALFWPMIERHEVDLRPLDATLRSRGVQVAYP